MFEIKPIETIYRGYRFRSRLEARWAVFLDTLEVRWDYEPQGFDLGGLAYLPDFLIYVSAGPHSWLEIKPYAKPTHTEIEKARGLSVGYDGFPDRVILACGDPMEHVAIWSRGGEMWKMRPLEVFPALEFVPDDGGCRVPVPAPSRGFWKDLSRSSCEEGDDDGFRFFRKSAECWQPPNYVEAVRARSARFEHGQTPV
jgi:hypothetical protein